MVETHLKISNKCAHRVFSFVEGHPKVERINIGVPKNDEYKLSHITYVKDWMVKDKEESMFSQGWQLDQAVKVITVDEIQKVIARVLKGKHWNHPKYLRV